MKRYDTRATCEGLREIFGHLDLQIASPAQLPGGAGPARWQVAVYAQRRRVPNVGSERGCTAVNAGAADACYRRLAAAPPRGIVALTLLLQPYAARMIFSIAISFSFAEGVL